MAEKHRDAMNRVADRIAKSNPNMSHDKVMEKARKAVVTSERRNPPKK